MFEQDSGKSFNNLIAQLPGMVFYKNLNLSYIAASDYLAKLCGFKNAEAFHGRNDFELNCPASESASLFRAEDRIVIEKKESLICLQLHQYADKKIHIFLIRKSPVVDDTGEIVGVCGLGNEITDPTIGRVLFHLLSNKDNPKKEPIHCSLKASVFADQLSQRESELLFYFMRGFNNKEIASYLGVSARTIETYLERIKSKLKCTSRLELNEFCLKEGLMYLIPHSIVGKYLNRSIIC